MKIVPQCPAAVVFLKLTFGFLCPFWFLSVELNSHNSFQKQSFLQWGNPSEQLCLCDLHGKMYRINWKCEKWYFGQLGTLQYPEVCSWINTSCFSLEVKWKVPLLACFRMLMTLKYCWYTVHRISCLSLYWCKAVLSSRDLTPAMPCCYKHLLLVQAVSVTSTLHPAPQLSTFSSKSWSPLAAPFFPVKFFAASCGGVRWSFSPPSLLLATWSVVTLFGAGIHWDVLWVFNSLNWQRTIHFFLAVIIVCHFNELNTT